MKSFRIIGASALFLLPAVSFAQVSINEIMYDLSGSDTGREWVEIYNGGSSAVDISSYKFLESTGASNHTLTLIQGTATLPAGGFAVIVSDSAKFLADWPPASFSGNLFKASFSSLNNTGGTLILKDSSAVVIDQVTYASTQGASGDGNSLQKTASGWSAGGPTPGASNISVGVTSSGISTTTEVADMTSGSSSGDNVSSSSASAYSEPVSLSSAMEKMEFQISAGRDRLTAVGNTVTFHAVVTRTQATPEQGITYAWSFGDGTTGQGADVKHAYRFPGEYTVVLTGSYSDAQAVNEAKVTVVAPKVSMAKVSGGLEIANNSGTEINLEGWNLAGERRTFTFPVDTLISSGKKIIFADEVTGMSAGGVQLLSPIGKELATTISPSASASVVIVSSEIDSRVAIDDIRAKINYVKNKLAEISPPAQPIIHIASIPVSEPVAVATSASPAINTALVFQAPVQTSFVNTIFNFIKRIFIKD